MNTLRIVDRRPWPARWLDALDEGSVAWSSLLRPVSWVYQAAVGAHDLLSPRRPLPHSPLSVAVGNLRVGGTGKTPVVASLGRMLQEQGFKVAVVSRGYRAEGGGDEPQWIEQELGASVIVNQRRREGFEEARRRGAEAVLLDDGLQARDQAAFRLAIVLGRDLLRRPQPLPEGPLREPMHKLQEMDAVLIRREASDPPRDEALERARASYPQSFVFRLRPKALCDVEGRRISFAELSSMGPCLIVSGLARPSSFESDALAAGVVAPLALRFGDHASFDRSDGRTIEEWAAGQCQWLLCPEKNLRRLAALELDLPVLALKSEVEWEGGRSPLALLTSLLEQRRKRERRT